MQSQLSQFERHQLDVIARVTPHAMAGHLLNTTVQAVALAGSIPNTQLIVWCLYSYSIGLFLLYRHVRARGRVPRSFERAARRATIYALLLALPWGSMSALYLGALAHDEELILVALAVGMAASGTVLLSALPAAAFAYMSGILIPGAMKCLLLVNQKGYLLLGVLAVSYWWFLAALITKVTREIRERKQADVALKESEAELQEALTAGHVVAFTWDPKTALSRRSQNASQILGLESQQGVERSNDFLARVHRQDRGCLAAQIAALSPENPSYLASFRFIRPDGQEIWLEETGKAEFDAQRRYVRLKGLTRDITERKRAEERQRLLIRELDHRVKNALASVATVAQRTREGSASMDEFLQVFDGRIQSMANAHALLSRNHWHGVRLADVVHSELAPYVGAGCAAVGGPEVMLTAEATQPMAIVLHELVTNASKYGALTTPQGRITVRWDLPQEHMQAGLKLEWIETGGPPCRLPSQPGYGTRAIRSLVPYELAGTVDLAFAADGVRCTIELPGNCIGKDARPADAARELNGARLSGARLSAAPSP
ncbi:MAG TPA: HWE histidine kinase domain-containing protein [Hyphomicrobiaceae bacterium]|jgi:PAS domain S-box-containing protein|nr:HWE histidine kinase domain-containing protein [Hyphomicrobiaceae bacterium]